MLILHESTRMSVTMVRKNSRVSYIWMRIGIRTITVKQPSSKLTKMIMKLLLKSDRNMGDWLSLMVSSFYCGISWMSNIIDNNFSKSIKIYFLSPFSTKVVYTGNTWSAFSYTETIQQQNSIQSNFLIQRLNLCRDLSAKVYWEYLVHFQRP